jgi:hypothetical protein
MPVRAYCTDRRLADPRLESQLSLPPWARLASLAKHATALVAPGYATGAIEGARTAMTWRRGSWLPAAEAELSG